MSGGICINREHPGKCSNSRCQESEVMTCLRCKKDFCFYHLVGGFTRTHCGPCSAKVQQLKDIRSEAFGQVRGMVNNFPGTTDRKVQAWFERLKDLVCDEEFYL